MLETNLSGPDDRKIKIENFNLNDEYRLKFKEKSEIELQQYEMKILNDINRNELETKNILDEHWESLDVKPKSIYVSVIKPLKMKLVQ